jgi:hypothetical protein
MQPLVSVALRELVRVERRSMIDIGGQLPHLSLQLVAAVDGSGIGRCRNENAARFSAAPHVGIGDDLLLSSERLRQSRGARTRIRKRGGASQNHHHNSHLYVLQIGSLIHTWKMEWTFVRFRMDICPFLGPIVKRDDASGGRSRRPSANRDTPESIAMRNHQNSELARGDTGPAVC